MIYPDYLFVLLIIIIIISIIIICCTKSRKNKSNILGDAVILDMKKENYDNNDQLGDAIENIVNSAFNQVGQPLDNNEDKSVTINYNGTVYQGVNGINKKSTNDVTGYSGNDNHHNADTGSDNHVSKHDSYHEQHKDNHRHVHHHHHHLEHHHHHNNKKPNE